MDREPELQLRKVFVDSRYASVGASANDFSFELPDSQYLPPGTQLFVDDVQLANVWRTVEGSVNDTLYLREVPSGGSITDVILTLTSQQYNGIDLASTIKGLMNSTGNGIVYDVAFNTNTGSMSFTSSSGGYGILMSDLTGFTGASSDPQSAMGILRLTADTTIPAGASVSTPFVDLLPVHSVFLHSNLTDLQSSRGPRGESSIVKKIPLHSGFGTYIHATVQSSHDFVRCGGQTIKSLSFRLTDASGRLVPMHGAHVSFTLCFGRA